MEEEELVRLEQPPSDTQRSVARNENENEKKPVQWPVV